MSAIRQVRSRIPLPLPSISDVPIMQFHRKKSFLSRLGSARAMCKQHASWLACVFACLVGMPSFAASLQVSPITLELQAREPAQGLWLSNSGAQPLQAQVRVYAWAQENGEDVLKPTKDLVVSPPMLTIPPGQRQIVRLVRVGAGQMPPATEKTYRVVIDELPVALGVEGDGVKFVLRYSVPAFIAPAAQGSQAASVQWDLQEGAEGPVLAARNSGNIRAKITTVSATARNGKTVVLTDGLYGYVLAGSTRHWSLSREAAAAARDGTLDMSINETEISLRVGANR